MDKKKFELLEVRPIKRGFYFVTLFQFKKEKPEHPDYIRDWLEFDGDSWDYTASYAGTCYVCFIHERLLKDGNPCFKELCPGGS